MPIKDYTPREASLSLPPWATRPTLRERRERLEERLSPYATRSANSRGRRKPEDSCPMRTVFQRDRDRIIHTNAFRRLKHKTQVFIAPLGDHYVTRLTHTLEVTQIARTIARALELNENLVEAIALGHDLGHTPFGHVGEQVLNELHPRGFTHSSQSLRVVDSLEKQGLGLNLTQEVRQGIVSHSKPRGDFLSKSGVKALTLEAQVCRMADAVAYLNHDISDAIRAGLLAEDDLPSEVREVLGTRHSQRVDTMVWDVVESSWTACGEGEMAEDVRPIITMSPPVRRAMNELREYMFVWVYLPTGEGEEGRAAREIIRLLYHHFPAHPQQIPEAYFAHKERVERAAVDYIAGMTDNFAVQMAKRISPEVTGEAFRGLWTLFGV